MNSFELSHDPTDDYHFFIKGRYDEESDKFSFTMMINPSITDPTLRGFFEEIKVQLEKPRSLNDTKQMIMDMLNHPNPTMQQLGQIVCSAADTVWVQYLLDFTQNEPESE